MRDLEKTGGVFAIIGIATGALGGAMGLTRFGLVGLGILGVGMICWGLSGTIEGRMSFFHPGVRYSENYYGLAARAWGILICLAGMSIVVFSILLFIKPDLSFGETAASPIGTSVGMFFGGLVGMLYSITLIIGRAENNSSWLRRALSVPGRLFGVLVLLVSAGLCVAGALRIVAPQIYEKAVQSISESLPRPSTR